MAFKAAIMAAGEGKRMRPLTQNRPKVMLPVAGKPILEQLLLEMKKAGVAEYIFIVGYHQEKLREYFSAGEKWGVKIEYAVQPEQGGTADAVRVVEKYIDDRFIVANGDILADSSDIKAIMDCPDNAMSLYEVENPEGLGTVETDGDRVKRIHEKVENPPSNLANAGLYVFTKDIFRAIAETQLSERGEYELTDSVQRLVDNNIKVAYIKMARWLDVGYPWDLLTANELLLKDLQPDREGIVEENVVLKGSVSIGKGTVVRSGSYIEGPVMIGEDCSIGPNCYIRPTTVIGNGCHIGAAAEVKNSVVMNRSNVPHLNYVGDSVIGEDCNLGAGTKIANLKLNKQNISIDGKDTGRRKLGAIIGDGVQTGINSSINTGTVIGAGARIGPGAFASGTIAPGTRIFLKKSG